MDNKLFWIKLLLHIVGDDLHGEKIHSYRGRLL